MAAPKSKTQNQFFKLTADKVIDSVEAAMQLQKPGVRATGRVLALNSLENRVYEIEFEDNSFVVAKFYRPERWTKEQILEEHEFLRRLKNAEIPVVSPLDLKDSPISKLAGGPSLAISPEQILFTIFPKVRGRLMDELSKSQLQTLGRYIGRMHQIGKIWQPKHRLKITSPEFVTKPFQFLAASNFLDPHMKPHYEKAAKDFLEIAIPRLKGVPLVTCHGDCHLGNTLWDGEAPFLLDFDDSMLAPAVQDIWMVIRGRDEEALKNRDDLLTGYEQMAEFDEDQLDLIEPLRGIRIIHYSAWIAKRWEDPSFPNVFAQFGSQAYWRSEIEALMEITELMMGYNS